MTDPDSDHPSIAHDLPAGVVEWAADVGNGRVTRLERHVARREAWVVDVTRPDGTVLEGFLRIDREPDPGNPWSLQKETGIVQALAGTPVPVPAVYGWNDHLSCVLFERVPGDADLPAADERRQRAVMEHFIDVMAALHTLDPDDLDLPPMHRPAAPLECALAEVDLILDHWTGFLRSYTEPLLTYAVDWLRRSAPPEVQRLALVQGDTGPVNFLFDGDRVSAVIDWEWGHLGDPLEDLGNICVREFWNPSGGLDGLFERYQAASGITVDLDTVRYYRVQQNVRGMVPIHAATARASAREPIAWYLAYRFVGDRATCEAIAEAMGIALDTPDHPADAGTDDILTAAAQAVLEHDVAPAIADPFARSRLADAGVLLACADRVRRYGQQVEAAEQDELERLLGRALTSVDDGLRLLDDAIRGHAYDDATLLRYLARRCYRLEWLYEPATTGLCPNRQWAPLR